MEKQKFKTLLFTFSATVDTAVSMTFLVHHQLMISSAISSTNEKTNLAIQKQAFDVHVWGRVCAQRMSMTVRARRSPVCFLKFSSCHFDEDELVSDTSSPCTNYITLLTQSLSHDRPC